MGFTLPAVDVWRNAATEAIKQQWGEDIRGFISQLVGANLRTEKTITGGATGTITPDQYFHTVDTEADAPTDDLHNLGQSQLYDGAFVLLRCEDASRVTTLKHLAGGTGQMELLGGQELELDSTSVFSALYREGTKWVELWRSKVNLPDRVVDTVAAVGSPLVLVADDNKLVLTNRGAVATAAVTLPPARAGLEVELHCVPAQAFRANAAAGDTIRSDATNISTAGGYAEVAAAVGNFMHLRCLDGTEWVNIGNRGTITVA